MAARYLIVTPETKNGYVGSPRREVIDDVSPAASSRAKGRAQLMTTEAVATLRQHLPLIMVVLVYWLIGRALLPEMHGRVRFLPPSAMLLMLLYYSLLTVLLHAARTLLKPGGSRELWNRQTWRDYRSGTWSRERVIGGLVMIPLFQLTMATFSVWKNSIPRLHPFAWDQRFAEWDQLLHFGVDPWRFTHAVASGPITFALDEFYFLGWNLVMFFFFNWYSWGRWGAGRLQYLLTFLLCWIVLGSGVATWLSSAGPVYFQEVTGSAYYSELVARLHELHSADPMWSVTMQGELWDHYQSPRNGIFRGISAMPSLHVAMATLIFLGTWSINRALGIAGGVFLLVVAFCSVHFGWHYALDGYVSFSLVALIWIASGRFARYWLPQAGHAQSAID